MELLVRKGHGALRIGAGTTLMLLAACSSGGGKKSQAAPTIPTLAAGEQAGKQSSAGAPWVVCGQPVQLSPAGDYIEDASRNDIKVTRKGGGDLVVLQLSHDCNTDPRYQVVPPSAATVVRAVPASKPIALILHPTMDTFTVTFQRPSGPGKVTVDLTQPTTGLGTPTPLS